MIKRRRKKRKRKRRNTKNRDKYKRLSTSYKSLNTVWTVTGIVVLLVWGPLILSVFKEEWHIHMPVRVVLIPIVFLLASIFYSWLYFINREHR